MKLHLPLTLLAALMAVLTLHTAPAETLEANGISLDLDAKTYTDGVQLSISAGGIVNMNSASTVVLGDSVITMDAGTFNLANGSLAGGDNTSAMITLNDSVFNMLTSSTAYVGNGRNANVTINLNDNGTINHDKGVVGYAGAIVTVNINNGGTYNLSNGTFSSFYKIYDSVTQRTEGTINIYSGGIFNLSGSAYLGYNGANSTVHVYDGGKFIQTGGMLGFARLAEYGRTEVLVHSGGDYTIKAGAIAPTNGRVRITIEEGGVFNQYGNSSAGAEIAAGAAVGQPYVEFVVKSGGVYNFTGGSVAVNNLSKSSPQVLFLVSGQLNQTGGSLAAGAGKALLVLQEGATLTQSGGSIGSNNGTAGLDIRRGSSYTLRGNGVLTGNAEVALGSTPELTVAPPTEKAVWDTLSPDAPAESGSFTFTQEGGTISGSVTVSLTGADATFTQSGGTITDSVSFTLSGGALFLQDENGDEAEISGSASISLSGSGTTFNQLDGAVTGEASLTLSSGALFSQSGTASFTGASLSGSGSGTKLTQSGGTIDTQLSLSGGATFEQTGDGSIAGSITLADSGTHFTQNGGSISASIELSGGATFEQLEGRVTGSISVIGEGSVYTQKGGSIGSTSAAADINLSDGGQFLQEGGTLFGDIILSDAGATFSQGGNIAGNVSVSGGASYTQQNTDSSVLGHVSVQGSGSSFSQQGSINSGAEVTDGGTLTQGSSSASISGGASVSGSGSSLSQQGSISGDVQVSNGGTLTQQGSEASIDGHVSVDGGSLSQAGKIAGMLTVTNGGQVTQSDASASIGGGAFVSGSGSSLAQQGVITGDVQVSSGGSLTQGNQINGQVSISSGGSLSQTGADSTIAGDVQVDGAGSLFSQASSVSGGITVTNGGQVTQSGAEATVGAGVSVSGSGSSFTQKGTVSGDVTVSSKGSFTQNAAISGKVSLTSGATLSQGSAAASIGSDVLVDASTLTQQGTIGGSVTVTNKGSVTQSGADAIILSDVTVSGGSSFTQTGSICGAVTVADSTFTQGGSISGKVTVTNSTYKQTGAEATIASDVEVSGGNFTQLGEITGNLTLSGGATMNSSAAIGGEINISGKSTSFTHKAGELSSNISISEGATFSHQGGSISGNILLNNAKLSTTAAGISAGVVMNGASASYSMNGTATSGSVTLHGGTLSGASAFSGELYIDTAADYTSAINLGNVNAGSIKQVLTRSATALVNNIGSGTLTLSADTVNSMVLSSATSQIPGGSAHSTYLINFASSGGRVEFEEGAQLVLNFSSDMLVEGKKLKDGIITLYITNGTLGIDSEDVLKYFNFGSLSTDDFIKNSKVGQEQGTLVLTVNMDGIWVASEDGTQVDPSRLDTLNSSKMVVVDEDMRIQLSGSDVILHQLIGDGSTYGNLTITGTGTIELNNEQTGDSTVFNGNLTVTGSTNTRKTGAATLTLGGTLTTAGHLSIEGGALNLYGTGNKVGALSMESGTSLALTGDLTLTGTSDVQSGTLSGGGLIIVQGGSLTLSDNDMELSLTLRSGAQATQKAGSITGDVILEDNTLFTHEGETSINGSVTLSGQQATMDANAISGESLVSGEGAQLTVAASVADATLSGKGAKLTMSQDAATTGALTLTGESSSATLASNSTIGGDVLLSGKNASLTAAEEATLTGAAEVSGEGAQLKVAGSVQKSLLVSGASATAQVNTLADSAEISGKGASLTAQTIGKNLTLSGEGTTAEVQQIQGTAEVSGKGATLSGLTAANTLVVSGEKATVSGEFTVAGDAVVSGSQATVGSMTMAAGTSHRLTISGKQAKITAAALSDATIALSGDGAELSVKDLQDSTLALSGKGAVLELNGSTGRGSDISLTEGELRGAANYAGTASIDIAAGFSGDTLKLGGLKGESITSLNTRKGISITGLGKGSTLTFSGSSLLTIGQQSVALGSGEQPAQAALVFEGGSGTVQVDGQVKLAFAPDVAQSFSSGSLTLWLTNGSVAELKDLTETGSIIAWLEQHFLLETGSGLSITAFSGSEEEGGKIIITAALDKVWQTSQDAPGDHTVTDPDELGRYTQVVVDRDTHLDVAVDKDTTTTIKQVHGDSDLTISNSGSGELTVELRNEDILGHYGETTFGGNITVDTEHVTIAKVGNADLTVEGNLQTPNDVQVRNGKLILNGSQNSARSLSFEAEETDADSLADQALVVNGTLTLTESSDLTGQTGSISGSGLLVLQGELKPGAGVSLNGPGVQLESSGSLNLEDAAEAAVGSLSGSGALLLGKEGALTITGGAGEFSGSLQGSGSLTITGRGTEQTLIGSGNSAYALENGTNSTLNLKNDGVSNFRSLVSGGVLSLRTDDVSQTSARLYTTDGIHLKASSTTLLFINFDTPAGINSTAPLLESEGNVILEGGSRLVIEGIGMGQAAQEDLEFVLIRGAKLYDDPTATLAGDDPAEIADGTELANVETGGLFDVFYEDAKVTVNDNHEAVFSATYRRNNFYELENSTYNSRAGADLLWAARAYLGTSPLLSEVSAAVADMISAGDTSRAARTMAAVAGSTLPALGTAQRDALREQTLRMRDHSVQSAQTHTAEAPRVHAWLEATGSYAKLNSDGDESGYKLNSWGGSVGADTALNKSVSLGLAISALYGDLDAEAAETASGKLDTWYLNLYLHGRKGKWGHSLVLSYGISSAEFNRTVDYGTGSYETQGSTSGTGLGALYELTYDVALNAEGTSVLQPLFSVSYLSTSMKGYDESGAEGAGLHVDEQTWSSGSVALGARWLALVGANALGRQAGVQLRAEVAQDFGDSRGETNVALLSNPGHSVGIRGAEVGSTGFRLGAGAYLPVGAKTQVYLNGSADLRSGSTSWYLNLGVQHGF